MHVQHVRFSIVVNVALSASPAKKMFVMVARIQVHAMNAPKAFATIVTAYLADAATRESVASALTMTPLGNPMERFVAPATNSVVAIVSLVTIFEKPAVRSGSACKK